MAAIRWTDLPMPEPLDPSLLSRMAALGSAMLGDAMGSLGVMAPAIRHVAGPARLCGAALPVDAVPGDNLALHRALAHPGAPGAVLVMSAGGGGTSGVLGELMARDAVGRAVAGLVVDGYVRDVDVLGAGALPVFARGAHPQRAGKANRGRVGWPVACGGVAVSAGDAVVGDADGVTVVPRALAAAVIEAAEAQAAREVEVIRRLDAGERLADVQGIDVS